MACSDASNGNDDPYVLDAVSAVTVRPRPELVGGSGNEGGNGGSVDDPIGGGGGSPGGAPATGAGGGAAGMGPKQYCDAVEQVFIPRCGGGSCHNRPDATIADFAVGPEEAASYVDVPSVRNAACGLIIDSADPAESLIYRKLTGDFVGGMCGGFMPVSGGDLTEQQLDCVADWVEQFKR